MFIAIGEPIIARVAALGGYISFSVTGCPKTPYEQVKLYVPGLLSTCFLGQGGDTGTRVAIARAREITEPGLDATD